jgi:uncharacterized protein YceH (UPF0502 family)
VALTSTETRVLGCLLEKQRTTPDAYPLSLNALRLACNQSTNRDPVVDYDESVIRDALHRLERRGYVRLASGAGSRAAKFRHLLAEALPMDDGERAVISVLMLRGAQTPGELKQRTERMHALADLAAVQQTLGRLIERGLVARLERRPGQKEERYRQLLQEGAEGEAGPAETPAKRPPPDERPAGEAGGLDARVARLEREIAELRAVMRNPLTQQTGQTGQTGQTP